MAKYLFELDIGFVGAGHKEEMTNDDFGIDNYQWNKLSRRRKEEILEKEWEAWIWNYIDGGYKRIE